MIFKTNNNNFNYLKYANLVWWLMVGRNMYTFIFWMSFFLASFVWCFEMVM